MNTKTRKDHANDIRARRCNSTNTEDSTLNTHTRNIKHSVHNLFASIKDAVKDVDARDIGRKVETTLVKSENVVKAAVTGSKDIVKAAKSLAEEVQAGRDEIRPERIDARNAKAEAKARAKAEAANDDSDLSAEELKELDDLCNS